jgi:hypothetical protein
MRGNLFGIFQYIGKIEKNQNKIYIYTSLIPAHNRAVTINTRIAAHGSTTISSPGICRRAKKAGKLSPPPKNNA